MENEVLKYPKKYNKIRILFPNMWRLDKPRDYPFTKILFFPEITENEKKEENYGKISSDLHFTYHNDFIF
jgi:hypothetical protein